MPGIYFAGTIGQGVKGLQKHGVPSNSGAVHGARYNARVLAGRIAETHFGHEPERPPPRARRDRRASSRPSWPRRPSSSTSAATSPGCSPPTRRAASATTASSRSPTSSTAAGRMRIAATLEADGSGAIYPVVYTRIGGKVVEQAIESDPLMRFDTTDARRAIARARRDG